MSDEPQQQPVPVDDPPPADRQTVVGALAHAAADLGWLPVGAHSSDTEITFVCRPG